MNEIKNKIKNYVWDLLYQHDISPRRSENNKNIMNRIINKCIEDLERHTELLELLKNDWQIEYYVRQTILYMI